MDWWLIILALIAAALAYLNAFEGGSEARRGIGRWINYYNGDRAHSSHNGLTPNDPAFQREVQRLHAKRSVTCLPRSLKRAWIGVM